MRLIRTNLTEKDVEPVKEALTQALFDHIPVGVGSQGIIPTTAADLEAALEMGVDWSLRCGGGGGLLLCVVGRGCGKRGDEAKGWKAMLPLLLVVVALGLCRAGSSPPSALQPRLPQLYPDCPTGLLGLPHIHSKHTCEPQQRGLRVGRGQGALRGVRPHAQRGPLKGLAARQEARPAADGHARRGQPLRGCVQAHAHAHAHAGPDCGGARVGERACARPRARMLPLHMHANGQRNHMLFFCMRRTHLHDKTEIQVVDEIFDEAVARKMGLDRVGQVGRAKEGGGARRRGVERGGEGHFWWRRLKSCAAVNRKRLHRRHNLS